ncbi:protein NnrT [Roseovarius sp. EL26]|uniref:protein NnrT n=1 Tax=Roseovarius sp. EL26 TaxID=2126672 RepID=UPI000EA15229|nr:protein NnrT [Roseovarius sp. EL26]
MRYIALVAFLLTPLLAHAEAYERPIPQAQSATAELWFLIASFALIVALWGVQKLVSRR